MSASLSGKFDPPADAGEGDAYFFGQPLGMPQMIVSMNALVCEHIEDLSTTLSVLRLNHEAEVNPVPSAAVILFGANQVSAYYPDTETLSVIQGAIPV